MENLPDPFRESRERSGVLVTESRGEPIAMILRHEDVRRAAKDWHTFSSDAPFRVPIPAEADVRSVRQLPIETNPPDHTEYRDIVEPFFRRAKDPTVIAAIEALVDGLLSDALGRASFDVVREFALPLQSRALAFLLNVPVQEAETWIGWGTHVFRDGTDGRSKGAALEEYLNARFDQALREPGEDFFSALTQASFRGRPLTREELLGFANLTFAGGRDTIIFTLSSIFAYLGRRPEALGFLRADPRRIINASEEFFRAYSPLTHIGRVCPAGAELHGTLVEPGARASLCWASANMDPAAFEAPSEVRLDRKPNPHLAFGSGAHLCLGAPHARLLVRTLLQSLANRVDRIEVLDSREKVEEEKGYRRTIGYELLSVRLLGIT